MRVLESLCSVIHLTFSQILIQLWVRTYVLLPPARITTKFNLYWPINALAMHAERRLRVAQASIIVTQNKAMSGAPSFPK